MQTISTKRPIGEVEKKRLHDECEAEFCHGMSLIWPVGIVEERPHVKFVKLPLGTCVSSWGEGWYSGLKGADGKPIPVPVFVGPYLKSLKILGLFIGRDGCNLAGWSHLLFKGLRIEPQYDQLLVNGIPPKGNPLRDPIKLMTEIVISDIIWRFLNGGRTPFIPYCDVAEYRNAVVERVRDVFPYFEAEFNEMPAVASRQKVAAPRPQPQGRRHTDFRRPKAAKDADIPKPASNATRCDDSKLCEELFGQK